jgi:hypothetical protein
VNSAIYSKRASLIDEGCKCGPLHIRMVNWNDSYKSNKRGSVLPMLIGHGSADKLHLQSVFDTLPQVYIESHYSVYTLCRLHVESQ